MGGEEGTRRPGRGAWRLATGAVRHPPCHPRRRKRLSGMTPRH